MTDVGTSPNRQLWAEALHGPMSDLPSIPTPLLRKGEPVAYLGGKLAASLIAPLAAAGFPNVVSDRRHPSLADIPPEAAEYETFGHGYGEVHTAREFRQLVERAARTFAPKEDRWREDGRVIDPHRPDLLYAAVSDQEFDVLQERHLNAIRAAFRRARTLVVSLSRSEIWEARADGAVFPFRMATADRHFDPERHVIRLLTVEETILDLMAAVKALRTLNPDLTIVVMISPEPQLATVLNAHVHVAGTLGKAVLRVAVEAVAGTGALAYFPALEIAALQAPASAYDDAGIIPEVVAAAVADALVGVSEGGSASFTGEVTPVAVLRTMPSEPRPPRKAKAKGAPVAEPAKVAPTQPAEGAAKKSKAQAKPKAAGLSVVDPYSEAKAAEAKARAKRRAEHLEKMGEAVPPLAELEAPTLSPAERKVKRREKALAREAKGAAQPQTDAAATGVGPTDAAKANRKIKKQRKAEGAGPSDAAAGATSRRERKRAAKG